MGSSLDEIPVYFCFPKEAGVVNTLFDWAAFMLMQFFIMREWFIGNPQPNIVILVMFSVIACA